MKTFLFITAIIIVLIIFREMFRFMVLNSLKRTNKKIIAYHLSTGLLLSDAIKTEFEKLNKNRELDLKFDTIATISKNIANLENKMNVDNVAEVYSDFIFWHIFKSKLGKRPTKIIDAQIISLSENMKFNIKDGYYMLIAKN